MIPEVSDYYDVLASVHQSIDKMVEGLTETQWLHRPNGNFNNLASVVDHVVRVEKKFMSAIAGQPMDMDTQLPFNESAWNVAEIQKAWADMLPYVASVLENVGESDLVKPGMSLRVGDLNRRQLIVYTIGHTTHHRGQIPLLLKLM